MLKEIDLNDPTTKALYDLFPENEKDEFEDAYTYLKYMDVGISVLRTMVLPEKIPLSEKAQKFLESKPDIIEHFKKYGVKYAKALAGGPETSFYNAKVVGLKDAIKLVSVDIDVNLEVPRTVMPFKLARNIILEGHPIIAIGPCPCRAAMPDCKCLPYPYEACFLIGKTLASFMVEHSESYRIINAEEAVSLLEGFHKQGFVQNAFFKKDMGDRFYAICNCCSCCCPSIMKVNMQLDGIIPFANAAPSGLVAVIGDDCNGCGICVEKCAYHAIRLNEDETRAEIISDRCMGCRVCEDQCPMETITMRVEPSKSGVLDLNELRKAT